MQHINTKKTQLFSLKDLRKLYDESFRNVKFSEEDNDSYEPIYYFNANDGKRIRPLLLLASCNMFGGDLDEAINPAIGIQLFHNFTLVHDDIMDEADLRRNQATVHIKYGLNSAVMAGDILMIKAYDFLAKVKDQHLRESYAGFSKMASEIIEGQLLDLEFESRMDVREDEYIKMIGFKTSVLLAESLRIGAIVADTSASNKELIYKFGLSLGLSFQIKDDWLDSFGESELVGKKIGGDILQNKKTMLFVKAWELADDASKAKINALMSEPNEDKKISEMLGIYRDLGVDTRIEALMQKYFDEGMVYLEKLNVDDDRKNVLRDFANAIYDRKF